MVSSMKWGKDPEKRTKFGVWLDDREVYQNQVVKASGLSSNSILSVLCSDLLYKPSYLVYRKLKSGLEKMGYPDIRYEDFC
jgi:hypothetical protein